MRAFISLNISRETAAVIKEFQDTVKHSLGYADSHNFRWETPDKFHITIFFIGDTEETEIENIKNCLADIKEEGIGTINLELGRLSGFPDIKRPNVLFVELKDNENKLQRLNKFIKDCVKSLGFEHSGKYHAHITLGRVKRNCRIKMPTDLSLAGSFEIRNISLMKSTLNKEGAIHECLFNAEL